MSGFSMGCGLRAWVLVEAAPVDGLCAEVEAALDLDPVDVEAVWPAAGFVDTEIGCS